MPILIKSSDGQRTCKMVSQNTAIRDDIIEALKGLTFKFEVKIVDVESKDTKTTTMNTTINTSVCKGSTQINSPSFTATATVDRTERPFNSVPSQETNQNPTPATRAKMDFPDNGFNNGRSSGLNNQLDQKPTVFDGPKFSGFGNRTEIVANSRPQQQQQQQPSQVFTAAPAETQPTSMTGNATMKPSMIPDVLTKKLGMLEKPKKPKVIRGELQKLQKTCCITVEKCDYPAVAYITYSNTSLLKITELISEASCDIEAQPEVRSVEVGDIVFAKSQEDNSWYRSMIMSINGNVITVDFFDWGLTENLELDRIRRMSIGQLGLSNFPACAVKVRFENQPGDLLDEALKCESEFDIQVHSYDSAAEMHNVTILSIG